MDTDYRYFEDDEGEDEALESCPNCERSYDEFDYDYQTCSKCGYDAEEKSFGHGRRPTDADYLNGDADIITGEWV